MKTKTIGAIAATILASQASAVEVDYSADAGLGHLYDSNVSVDALDVKSREGDSATEFYLKAGVKADVTDDVALKAKVRFKDKSYSKFNDFDLQTIILSTEASYKLAGRTKASLSYYDISGDLGGSPYLEMSRISPAISTFIGDDYYLRAEVTFVEKEFEINTDRDSDSMELTVSGYHFMNGGNSFFSGSFTNKRENADNDLFDNRANEIKVAWNKKMDWVPGKATSLKAGFKLENKAYSGADSAGDGNKRSDVRSGLNIELTQELGYGMYVKGLYDYTTTTSNLDTQDADQDIVSLHFGWKI